MWWLALACSPPPPIAPPPRLRINEVMTDNVSVRPDAEGRYEPWLELYNASRVDVDLAEVTLDEGQIRWTGDGVLGPGGRRLLWAPGDGGPDGTHFAFAPGDTLTLTWRDQVVDAVVVPETQDDTAWARFPDGSDHAAVTARPTPGRSNGARPPASDDPSDALFQDALVLDFELVLGPDSLASLSDEPTVDTPAGFAFGEAVLPEISARIKGGWGSARSIDQKCAFKLDLNAYEDRRFRGLEALTLNNVVQDPSYVHESLAYELFRAAGVPAPRVGWARLFVNGELHGLMTNVETVDDRFLRRWFDDPSGTLWEGSYGADFVEGYEYFELDEGPEDTASIDAITTLVSGTPTEAALNALEKRFDMDNLLTVMAVEAVSLHWDGYTTANNYRIYQDPSTGRYTMIPWGTDQTFHDVWYGPYDGGGRLFTFCLAVSSCRDRYDAELRRVADLMDSLHLDARLAARAAMLRDDIEADPRREWDFGYHDVWVADTAAVIRAWPDEVRSRIP